MVGKIDREKFETLRAIIASRKTRVAPVVSAGSGRQTAPADCPVCGAPASDVLRIKAIEGDTWRVVLCDACGPEHGGLLPVLPPVDPDPDLTPGETRRTAMLDQGDDDMRWEMTDAILVDVDEEAAEKVMRIALDEVEGETPPFARGMPQKEWIGGGLATHAENLYASEIFSDWPDRETWRVLCVLDARRLTGNDIEGEVFVAVVNRGAGRGVWCIS